MFPNHPHHTGPDGGPSGACQAPAGDDATGPARGRRDAPATTTRPYLLAWDLSDRRVVVVGGGAAAEAKVETLRGTGAGIVVVAPEVGDRIRSLARSGELTWLRRRFRPWDVARAALLIAATGTAADAAAARWARRRGIPVNVVDDPSRCDVTVPATVTRGPATIAVTTGGATPAGARFLRETIGAAVPAEFGDVLLAAAETRRRLRRDERYRYDYPAWKQRLFEPALAAVRSGRPPAAAELANRFVAEFDRETPLRSGTVTLVGAGPGGAGLITRDGAAALAACDVVIHDRLVDPALVDLAPRAARRIPVGKAKGGGTPQDEINALLVATAAAGHDVVRLKGGDGMVFGRGGEEAAAATAAGVPVRIIPGVSSALAAPGLAGIPVTDRRVAASVTVLTGHRASGEHEAWSDAELGADTLVVLMAASTASEVATTLLAAGRRGDEPVAAVHAAGTPDQDVAVCDLAGLAARGCPFPSPTVLVVGEVVKLRTPVVARHDRAATVVPADPGVLVSPAPRPVS